MKKNTKIYIVLFCFLLLAQSNNLFASEIKAVSTFHAIGLYWSPADGSNAKKVLVKFRSKESTDWHDGLPMRYNPIGGTTNEITTYRGSIVNLTPNTTYEIELTLEGTDTKDTILSKTWTEDFPIGETITLGDRTIPFSIYESGTKDAYVLIDGTNATIDVENNHDYCVTIRGSYVILRGVTLKNGRKGGIDIKTCHDVIIENCDISGWGEQDSDGFGVNYQAAVHSNSSTIERIVVQRCRIHNPRYDSNSWAELNNNNYHPSGPHGVYFYNSNGNNVIRYNEIWSDSEHMYNDILGGLSNQGYRGFPGPDSDIYSNYLANCWDDGIESEGGNRNVRIWGNYIEEVFLPIANAATSIGPLYIWKNTSGRCYSPPGSYYGVDNPFIKMGFAGSIDYMTGHMYIFNNTILQPNNEGAGGLGTGGSSNRYIKHCQTRNNILDVKSVTVNSISIRSENSDNNYDYDLYSANYPSNNGGNAINGRPIYIKDAGFNYDEMKADFSLNSNSPGYDAGEVIPNFADKYNGIAPDVGAFESDNPPMEYGVNAYLTETSVKYNNSKTPRNFTLLQNYPNPFNPTTTIEYSVTENSTVTIAVYNMLGEKIKVIENTYRLPGSYTCNWDSSNNIGGKVTSGIYIYKMTAVSKNGSQIIKARKMILMK